MLILVSTPPTTTWWTPLLAAVITFVGTLGGALGGVLITQRRERERERQRWKREDELRNFEARRDAYMAFYESLSELARMVEVYLFEGRFPPRAPNAKPMDSVFDPMDAVRDRVSQRRWRMAVFAPPALRERALEAYQACSDWIVDNPHLGDPHAERNVTGRAAYREADERLRDAIRVDLGMEPATDD